MHSQGGVHIPVRGIDRCWAEALCCDTRNCSQAPPAHCLVPAVVCVRPYPTPTGKGEGLSSDPFPLALRQLMGRLQEAA